MAKLNYNHTIKACYLGYIMQAIVNNFVPLIFLILQSTYNISLERITFLITINFAFQLMIDFLSTRFVDKIGYRISICSAFSFSAAGLFGLTCLPKIFPPYIGLIISVVLYAVGGGLIEVLISPMVEACPTSNKSGTMSLLHSFYCWGSVGVIVVSTAFLAIFGKNTWYILAVIWAVFALICTYIFTRVPIATLTEAGQSTPLKKLFSKKTFILYIILMFAAGASELAMSQWASAFAEKGLGISKAMGDLAGPCFFAVLMGISRVFYAKFSEKIDLLKFIIANGVLCIFSYMAAAAAPIPVVSLIACGICGLSVGILWPGVYSLASKRYPLGGTAMFAILALAGDLGCTTGPTLVGIVSGFFGDDLKFGIAAAAVFPLVLVAAGVLCKKTESN